MRSMEGVIRSLEANIQWLAPLALPLIFVTFSVFFQLRFGQTDFRFLGGEVGLAASASLLGSVLHSLLMKTPQAAAAATVRNANVLGVVVTMVSLVLTVWFYSMGRDVTKTGKVVGAVCLGTAWFYLSA